MHQINSNPSMQKSNRKKITANSMIDSGSLCHNHKNFGRRNSTEYFICTMGHFKMWEIPQNIFRYVKTRCLKFVCVEDGHKLIIRKECLCRLGLVVVKQQVKRGKRVNNIDNSTCKVKQAIALPFPDLVSRIGLSKTHAVKSKFHPN